MNELEPVMLRADRDIRERLNGLMYPNETTREVILRILRDYETRGPGRAIARSCEDLETVTCTYIHEDFVGVIERLKAILVRSEKMASSLDRAQLAAQVAGLLETVIVEMKK